MIDAPTDITVTQELPGSPHAHIACEHDGTNLDRLEFLQKAPGEELWTSVVLVPAASIHSSGMTYEIDLASPPGAEWAARAWTEDGEVSV